MGFRSIKKKVRGLRGKVKRIEWWKEQHLDLDLNRLEKYGKEYVKVWISPFYNLYTINKFESGHKNPPNWFNRLILRSMIDIYKSWEIKLKETGQPYYLKIWLYDPNFVDSQIVAAIGDNINYYLNLFEKDNNRQFPYEEYSISGIDLKDFNWVLYKDQYVVFESEHTDEPEYLNYIKKRAAKVPQEKVLGNDETCYYIRSGNIWVGSM